MRTLLFLALFLVTLNSFAQSNIQFRDIGFQQALKSAHAENKLVFFMGFASWCGHCKNMKEEVFTDSSVANFYNSHFVCISMDMEKGDGMELKKKLDITSYPGLVFVDSTGKTVYQIMGEFKPADFIEQGKNSMIREKQLPYLQQQFEANPSDSDKCLQYLLALRRGGLDATQMIDTYFSLHTDQQLISPMNWRIVNMGISDIQSPHFKFLLSHQKEYAAVVTQAKVERKIFRTAAYSLQPIADNNDTSRYFRVKKTVSDLGIFAVDSLLFNYDLTLYENNNKWSAYQATAIQHTQQYAWNDYAQLRHIADAFLKHVDDVSALKLAAGWAKRSTTLKEEYGNTLLYAKLLAKTGDRAAATEVASQAKTVAARTNANTAEADELLKQLEQ